MLSVQQLLVSIAASFGSAVVMTHQGSVEQGTVVKGEPFEISGAVVLEPPAIETKHAPPCKRRHMTVFIERCWFQDTEAAVGMALYTSSTVFNSGQSLFAKLLGTV